VTAVAARSEVQGPALASHRLAVVDTNVWLDLYFFCDPDAQALAGALASPCWVAARCERTDAELAAVVRRPRFSSNPAVRSRLLELMRRWQTRATFFDVDGGMRLRCRDPDDQKFLDLAFASRAAVLLTKDKALLSLDRKARHLDLTILTPRAFGSRFVPSDPPPA
jgi:putative PIN family toxin of toxin-antitoxin system